MRGEFALYPGQEARGFAVDLDELDHRMVIEILADGLPVGLLRANIYVDELRAAGIGDGRYGFVTTLPDAVLAGDIILEARIANTGEIIGQPIVADLLPARARSDLVGEVRWIGGLRLAGWMSDRESFGARIKAIVDGAIAAEAVVSTWTHQESGTTYVVRPSFELHLPAWMADGRVRHIDVVSSDGAMLRGTPVFVVGFADGLTAFIDSQAELESEKIRARYSDQLLPQSMPFSAFEKWSDRFPPAVLQPRSSASIGVVLLGESDIERCVRSLVVQAHISCIIGGLPCGASPVDFNRTDLLAFIENDAAGLDFLVFAPSNIEFYPAALASLVGALETFPKAQSAYCDVAVRMSDASLWPLGLTAFDYERCLEQGFCSYVFIMRREAVIEAVAAGADNLFRLFNAQMDRALNRDAEPVHVPHVLAQRSLMTGPELCSALKRAAIMHLDQTGGKFGVDIRHSEAPAIRIRRRKKSVDMLSIVVSTRNRAADLGRLISGLSSSGTDETFEIIVVDGDSSDKNVATLLDGMTPGIVSTVKVTGHHNPWRLWNEGAAKARGAYLLFLDDSVSEGTDDWFVEMVGRMSDPDIGAVGPLVVSSNGIVRGAGLVLGPGLLAKPALDDRLLGDPGYAGLLDVAHEVSAVQAPCLMTRRDLFSAHNGFDATSFTMAYGDIDYCLRLRAQGYRVIVTPDARVTIARPSGRAELRHADLTALSDRELRILHARWGHVIVGDPYYSPWLNFDGAPFSALAWPPRHRSPRQRHHDPARMIPVGL